MAGSYRGRERHLTEQTHKSGKGETGVAFINIFLLCEKWNGILRVERVRLQVQAC